MLGRLRTGGFPWRDPACLMDVSGQESRQTTENAGVCTDAAGGHKLDLADLSSSLRVHNSSALARKQVRSGLQKRLAGTRWIWRIRASCSSSRRTNSRWTPRTRGTRRQNRRRPSSSGGRRRARSGGSSGKRRRRGRWQRTRTGRRPMPRQVGCRIVDCVVSQVCDGCKMQWQRQLRKQTVKRLKE